MAVRDRFRRAVNKSDSSDNLSQTSSSMTATTTNSNTTKSSQSSEPSLIHKQPSNRLARAFTFGTRDKAEKAAKEAEKEEKERRQQLKAKKSKAALHPRDKPLTAQNLRHQEMLSQFTMTFGSSPNRMSQIITESDGYGVSPCCSRPGSIDGGIISPVTSRNGFDPSRVGVVTE